MSTSFTLLSSVTFASFLICFNHILPSMYAAIVLLLGLLSSCIDIVSALQLPQPGTAASHCV